MDKKNRLGKLKQQTRPAVFVLFLLGLLLLGGTVSTQAATPIDVGYRDHAYPSGVGSNSEVTAEKPESKLWWNDGSWWASMWSTSGNAYHIYKLDWATQNWSDTGTQLDDRKSTKADVLWDGQKLYVVSHIWSGDGTSAAAGQRGELFRYSYSGGSYTLDAGFPVEVSGGTSEALVIDKDSTGMLWVTYVQDSQVWVNHSQNGNDADWGTPYVLPVGSDANVDADDLSSLIAYSGHVGVMWSNQKGAKKMFFAVHQDGTDPNTWTSVAVYTVSGDDHINLKSLQSDPSGKVFAAVKTSNSAALLLVMVCHTGTCTSASDWTAHTAYTGADGGSPTRPALLIDTSNRDLYIFARVNNDIYYKRSDMDNVQFPSGLGDPFIQSAVDQRINDPTTTKQTVNNTTGIVVMASDRQTRYYFHNCIALAGSSNACIEANPAPSVFFSSATVNVNETAPTAELTVQLSQSMPGAVSVNYATQNGSALAGSDYTTKSGTLTFNPGVTSQTISVPIQNDAAQETDETFTVKLSNASGVTLGSPDTATVTIVDNDTPPSVMFDSATYTIAENGGSALVNVVLSAAFDSAVSVNYATGDNTAVAGLDYQSASGTLTFNPGITTQSFSVPILNDSLNETAETVNLTLSNPSVATLGTPSTATLTITDNDPLPTVSFSSISYPVGEQAGSATITVNLNTASGQAVSVNYATSDGTAVSGSDYTATSGILNFAPGEISKSFNIPILGDLLDEANETILLALSSPTNATLGTSKEATILINDDDDAPTVSFSSASYKVVENTDTEATISVQLSAVSGQTVSVNYASSNNTATAGSDYTAVSGTLIFDAGDISQTFTVPILPDDIQEGTETVNLTLSGASNATPGAITAATLSIEDDDLPPEASFDAASYAASEGAGQFTITVQLNRSAEQPVSVDYATADGTAVAGSDYAAGAGTLTFAPGETSKSFTISIFDDTENEIDETFTVSLASSTESPLNLAADATLTIIDDDRPAVAFDSSSYALYGNSGVVTIAVVLNVPAEAAVTVNYATSDGNAIAGSDYTATSGTLTFTPGTTRKTFTVPLLVGAANLTEKSFNVVLSSPQKAELGDPDTAVITILKNEVIYLSFLSG